MEKNVAINNNLIVDQVDQQITTPRRVSQPEQKQLWIEERLAGQVTPQATSIILREVQISEAQRHTNSLKQNSKRKKCGIENVDSQVEFR